jgi:hypothetical protein
MKRRSLLVAMICCAIGFFLSDSCGGKGGSEGGARIDDDDVSTDDDDDDDNDNDASPISDDDNDDNDDDDDTARETVWTDPTTGLMWQNGTEVGAHPYEAAYGEADGYCVALAWSGYSDWRLPSISELRSVIRDCRATETGGSCGVTDNCNNEYQCWNGACYGCNLNGGPGQGGSYWPPELICFEGSSVVYWSATYNSGWDGDGWFVEFNTATINQGDMGQPYSVRCVRSADRAQELSFAEGSS